MDLNAWDACSCQRLKRSHPPAPNHSPAPASQLQSGLQQWLHSPSSVWESESSRSASGPLRPRYTQISRLQHMPLQTPGHSEGFSCTQNSVVWGCFQLVFKVLIPLKTTTYWFNDSAAFGVRLIAVMTFHCLFVSLIWFKQQLQEFLSWFVTHFKEA